MRLTQWFGVALAVAVLQGCATAPTLQGARPAAAQNQSYALAKLEAVTRTDHMTRHLDDDKSIVYFQNQGGGGAGLGVLLGPLGVAANIKMIEGVTDADVEKLKGRIKLSPALALQQAVATTPSPVQLAATQGDVKVSPFMLVSKTNDTSLHISSVVLFEGGAGQSKWTRRYQYQLPGKYTLDELAALSGPRQAELQAASVAAYAELLKHIGTESDASIALERKVTLKSPYLSPRFEFEMLGSLIGERGGRVWVRTTTGVVAVEPSELQYQFDKG